LLWATNIRGVRLKGKSHSRESPNGSGSDTYIITFPSEFLPSYILLPIYNIADLYFPPSIEYDDPILYWASYILSGEAYWRQETYNFISENIGVIA
jgi:hypothetical protein